MITPAEKYPRQPGGPARASSGSESVLFLDVGNRRLKWRCADRGGAVVHGEDWSACCRDLMRALNTDERRPARARANLGSAHRFFPGLARAIQQNFAVPFAGLSVRRLESGPVRLCPAYALPEQLGCDRWCAMIAARHRFGPVPIVVVDAGSALTIDIVAGDGQHLGGHIVPGLGRMVGDCALLTGVDMPLQIPADLPVAPGLGRSPVDCVRCGIGNLVRFYLGQICENVASFVAGRCLPDGSDQDDRISRGRAGADPVGGFCLVLTGGDSHWLSLILAPRPVQVISDLVLEGVRLADSILADYS